MVQLNVASLIQLLLINSVVSFTPSFNATPRTSTHLQSTNRRDAIASFAAILGAGVAATATPEPASAQGMPLFMKVEKLESANYIGQVGRPIYQPNVSGEPEFHTPQVTVKGNDIEVYVNHKQKEDDYVQFLWLKDTKTNEVVLAKELTPADEKPSLKARVPSGVELTPYAFCKNNGLWKGEPFKVA